MNDAMALTTAQAGRLSDIEGMLSSDPKSAEKKADALVAEMPDHPKANLLLGIACRLTGNPRKAVDVLASLAESWPNAAIPYLHLGLAYRELGNHRAAIPAIRRATEIDPDFHDALLALADVLFETSDTDSADRAYAAYIDKAVSDQRLREPADALHANRLSEASTLLRDHLSFYPTDVVALCLLADVAEKAEQFGEAEKLLWRCLQLSPSYKRARHNYASVLLRQNKAMEALRECRRLLASDTTNIAARQLLAAILVRLREYDESIEVCEGLLKENANQPTVWTSLGHMLKTVGRREECINAYRQAIEYAPFFGEAYWSLMNLKTFRPTEAEMAAMKAQLRKPDLSETDQLHFHFALGKALELREAYSESFQNYEAGNRLRLERHPYNAEELADHVKRSIAFFTPAYWDSIRGCGAAAQDPIFIVGLPRSGSTLVEQILASHSCVEGTMELPDIAAIANSLNNLPFNGVQTAYPASLANISREKVADLGRFYIERTRVQRKLGTAYFIDKMPNNFAHVGLIQTILPNAKIIDVRRHPMACGMSLYKEHFARAQNFSYSLEDIGRYYRHYVELMRHFDRVLPGKIHRVVYESLVENTEIEIRRLLDYCQLPFESACTRFHENKRAVSTASAEQVRTPINRDGLDYWRNFEPWLWPLKIHLGPLIDDYSDPV
jgi:tetratricopeptide (TPR) repeat protein